VLPGHQLAGFACNRNHGADIVGVRDRGGVDAGEVEAALHMSAGGSDGGRLGRARASTARTTEAEGARGRPLR
jgi:hypothetical protein